MSDRFARETMNEPRAHGRAARLRPELGGILTAMVTPFDADGGFDEETAAALMHHLLEHGSDGLVLAGSTGEGATLTDEEKLRLWALGVAQSGTGLVGVSSTSIPRAFAPRTTLSRTSISRLE